MEMIIAKLRETSHHVKEHLWSQSMYAIQNHSGFDGLPFNNAGLFNPGAPINVALVEWWCMYDENHGYGIFHSWRWEVDRYVMVSFYKSSLR